MALIQGHGGVGVVEAVGPDGVAFRVVEVERWPVALCAVVVVRSVERHAKRVEMVAQNLLVEPFDAQAQMVHVVPVARRRIASAPAELAVDGNEVDQRGARAQVHEPEPVHAPVDTATERIAVERDHRLEVARADDDVVDPEDRKHGDIAGSRRPPAGGRRCGVRRP